MSKALAFTKKIVVESEHELYKMLVLHCSMMKLMKDQSCALLRPQLVTVLAFYVQYGYSTETKRMIRDVQGYESRIVDGLNHDLKEKGYLVEDPHNKRVKYIHKELEAMKKVYESDKGEACRIMYGVKIA